MKLSLFRPPPAFILESVTETAPAVVVVDYREPRQRLMSWFLSDSGIATLRVTEVDEAVEAIRRASVQVVIVNTTAPNAEVSDIVKALRVADAETRIIVLHKGRHIEDEPLIHADVCIHDATDADTLLDVVRAAMRDDIPDDVEPHEAAEAAI